LTENGSELIREVIQKISLTKNLQKHNLYLKNLPPLSTLLRVYFNSFKNEPGLFRMSEFN